MLLVDEWALLSSVIHNALDMAYTLLRGMGATPTSKLLLSLSDL
jgi:hypothetical protein